MKNFLNKIKSLRLPFREDLIFGLITLSVFIGPLAFTLKTDENFETVKFCLFLVLTGVSLIALSLNLFKNKEYRIVFPQSLALFFVGIFLFGLVSAVFNPNLVSNFFGVYTRYTNGFLFYISLMVFVLLLISKINRERFDFLLKILIIDAVLIAVYSFFQSIGIGIYHGIDANYITRSPSFLGNPNFSAFFIVAIFPFIFYFLHKAQSFYLKLYYGLSGFLMLLAVVIFLSRGALLGGILSIIFLSAIFLTKSNLRRLGLSVFLAIFLGVGMFYIWTPYSRPSVIVDTFKKPDINIDLRLNVWNMAFEAIEGNWFKGIGQNNFAEFYEKNRGKELADKKETFDDPHNLFLFQASISGIFFALSFFALLGYCFVNFIKQYFLKNDVLFACLGAGLVAWVIASSFTPVPVACFLLLAVILSGVMLTDKKKLIFLSNNKVIIFIFGLFGVFISVYGSLFLASEHFYFQAKNSYLLKNYESAYRLSDLSSKICPCNELYNVYEIASKIKIYKDSSEVLSSLSQMSDSVEIRSRSRLANLYFLLFLSTQKYEYGDIAVGELNKILNQNPFHAERQARMAFYLYEMSKYELAENYVNNSLIFNQNLFSSWILKARLRQIQNDKPATINALEKVSRQFPGDVSLKNFIKHLNGLEDIRSSPVGVMASYERVE